MTVPKPSADPNFQHLRDVRLAILRLHKALLDSERDVYEQFHGRIRSNNEYFQLVISHEWFEWLRPISQFIVQMDDVLNAKEPLPLSRADELLDHARSLLQPNESGTDLESRYYHAIQRDPAIALMHANLQDMLR